MSIQKIIMGPDGTLLKINPDGTTTSHLTDINGNKLKINSGGSVNVKVEGSYYRLSNEPKPTIEDGVEDGNDLLLVDTKQVFVFYGGEWREL